MQTHTEHILKEENHAVIAIEQRIPLPIWNIAEFASYRIRGSTELQSAMENLYSSTSMHPPDHIELQKFSCWAWLYMVQGRKFGPCFLFGKIGEQRRLFFFPHCALSSLKILWIRMVQLFLSLLFLLFPNLTKVWKQAELNFLKFLDCVIITEVTNCDNTAFLSTKLGPKGLNKIQKWSWNYDISILHISVNSRLSFRIVLMNQSRIDTRGDPLSFDF